MCLDDTTGEDNVFVYCDTTDCEVCVHQGMNWSHWYFVATYRIDGGCFSFYFIARGVSIDMFVQTWILLIFKYADCYGIKELPGEEDPWYCDRCKAKMEKPSEVVVRTCHPPYLLKMNSKVNTFSFSPISSPFFLTQSCVLCPNTHGAFRRLSENDASKGWIHVVCALWIQEVWLHDQVYIKEIEVKGIPAKKWSMVS